MAEIRETYVTKVPKFSGRFGGRAGSRATLWVVAVVIASLIVVGAIYLFPQYW